ncbi:MAG: ABC transporter substrate-binding protein [Acidimicrobiales bacterium]
MRKITAALVAVVLFAAACGDDDDADDATPAPDDGAASEVELVEDGVLTVATELPAPPFWIGDDYDSIEGGFEVDLARAIADNLGIADVQFVEMPFAGLVAGQECPCDIDFSQVTITDERAQVVDFTAPYFDANQGVLAAPEVTIETIDDAKAIRWGAQVNTTGASFVTDTIQPDTEVQIYNTTVDAFTALTAGQIDAVLLDVPIVLGAVQAGQVGDAEVIAQFETGEQYGGVLAKDSPNTPIFDDAIEALRDEGVIGDLLEEYFGADPGDIPVIAT